MYITKYFHKFKMQAKGNINFFGTRNAHNREAKGLWQILILLWHISLHG